MATGKITLYEGKSKKDGKPFKALRLEVASWDALYFVNSKFEMDYIEKQLKTNDNEDSLLDDDEKGMFD